MPSKYFTLSLCANKFSKVALSCGTDHRRERWTHPMEERTGSELLHAVKTE